QPVLREKLLKWPAELLPLVDEHATKKRIGRLAHTAFENGRANEFHVEPTRGGDFQYFESARFDQRRERPGVEEVHVFRVYRKRCASQLRDIEPFSVR